MVLRRQGDFSPFRNARDLIDSLRQSRSIMSTLRTARLSIINELSSLDVIWLPEASSNVINYYGVLS